MLDVTALPECAELVSARLSDAIPSRGSASVAMMSALPGPHIAALFVNASEAPKVQSERARNIGH
jgi:hypothetical protein